MIDTERASNRWAPGRDGDTTYLCTVDGNGMGVSLIQSNAAGFGSGLVEPNTGINLHNRGLGFNLREGHPAEFRAGRRPPHTLCPAMATADGALRAVFGTMGGDAQPQILLQLAARLFHYGQSPAAAINAGRWALRGPAPGSTRGPVAGADGHGRGSCAAGVDGRPRRIAATTVEARRRTTAASGTPTRSSSTPTGSGRAPPTRARWSALLPAS